MKVVVHDDVSMNGHLESWRVLLPQRQQAFPVCIVAYDGLAVIAALDDMVRVAGNSEAASLIGI
jgi:hypothetical protein